MSFNNVRGQEKPIEIIKEFIRQPSAGRGYLFCGPEGIGKKLLAKTYAKAINCESNSSDACDICASCLKIEQNQHPDIHLIEGSDTESIKIEDIRNLQREASFRPFEAKRKVFIIDNAHNLTPEAASALLKTLEEPAKDSAIILITAKVNLLFKTIVSRCQVVKFYPLPRQELEKILSNDFNLDLNMAHFLAYFSEGRLGLALKLKDSDIYAEKNLIIDELFTKKPDVFNLNLAHGKQEMRDLLNVLAVWLRDIYILKSGMPENQVINLDRKAELTRLAKEYSFLDLEQGINIISDSMLWLQQNINAKLILSNLSLVFPATAGSRI